MHVEVIHILLAVLRQTSGSLRLETIQLRQETGWVRMVLAAWPPSQAKADQVHEDS
jgi:hypothetical protein